MQEERPRRKSRRPTKKPTKKATRKVVKRVLRKKTRSIRTTKKKTTRPTRRKKTTTRRQTKPRTTIRKKTKQAVRQKTKQKPKRRTKTKKHMNTPIATTVALAALLYTPSFFSPAKADENYAPDLGAAFMEGVEVGKRLKLKSAQQILATGAASMIFATDLQEDFRDQGRLPVKGTNEVVLRTCVRLINGIISGKIAGIGFSLDGHPIMHTSFDHDWRDQNGNPMDLSKHGKAAILTLADEGKAIFKATCFGADGPYEIGFYQRHFDPKDAVDYWHHLQKTNQGPIWVFVSHCVIGTNGTNLHPLFAECVAFACGAISMQPYVLFKGHLENTDWFGPIAPCRPDPKHAQGGFQKGVIDMMKKFAEVDFVGVAEDFCDFNMKRQVMESLAGTEFIKKLRFVTDGTAPIVPNAAHVLKLNDEARAAGIQFINHASPFTV